MCIVRSAKSRNYKQWRTPVAPGTAPTFFTPRPRSQPCCSEVIYNFQLWYRRLMPHFPWVHVLNAKYFLINFFLHTISLLKTASARLSISIVIVCTFMFSFRVFFGTFVYHLVDLNMHLTITFRWKLFYFCSSFFDSLKFFVTYPKVGRADVFTGRQEVCAIVQRLA